MSSSVEMNEVVSIELPAPAGWMKRVTSLSSTPSELEAAIGYGPALFQGSLLLLAVHHLISSRLIQKLPSSDSFGFSIKAFKAGLT